MAQKKALVTGGSDGIGLAVVDALVAAGMTVWVVGRTAAKLDEVKSKHGKGVRATAMDVGDAAARARLVSEISDQWGRLDILVNNVGTNLRKRAHEYADAEVEQILALNLVAPMDLTRKLYPLLKAGAPASVVNVSSVASLAHVRSGFPYGASKAGLNQFTRNLAVEWAREGIRVNAVAPWYIETRLVESVLKDNALYDEVVRRTPMGRIGQPAEVAAAVAFFAGEASSYITGQVLAIDGGVSINLFHPG